ncbi:MAG TPA: hypothetical protein VMU88_00230 [bacterium]|nr:hypothetical protein [bacterium]
MVWKLWALTAALAVILTGGWACNHTLPTGSQEGPATNGAIVTVGFGGDTVFQPGAVTILAGTPVTWYYENGVHTVNVDDGTGTGSCADYDFTSSAPGTQVVETFNQAGRFNVHCDIHSTCGGSSPFCNAVCSTMTATVSVR